MHACMHVRIVNNAHINSIQTPYTCILYHACFITLQLQRYKQDLSAVQTLETGKPLCFPYSQGYCMSRPADIVSLFP